MAHIPEAGLRSGCGSSMFLDSSKPMRGHMASLRTREPVRARTPAASVNTGDSHHCEVLSRTAPPSYLTGGIPRAQGSFQQVCIPGYRGHIHGKVAENLHGQTFGAENERAGHSVAYQALRRSISAPDVILGPEAGGPRGSTVPPRVPGYAGNVPGKRSETVHAMRFAEASEEAARLREYNPHVTCDGWLRRGVWPADRMATYKWNNRFARADAQELFTPEQEQQSFESNRALGQTFGLKLSKHPRHVPGDRFLHSLHAKKTKGKHRIDATTMAPAGEPSHSAVMDGLRWRSHHAMVKSGNQRTAY